MTETKHMTQSNLFVRVVSKIILKNTLGLKSCKILTQVERFMPQVSLRSMSLDFLIFTCNQQNTSTSHMQAQSD